MAKVDDGVDRISEVRSEKSLRLMSVSISELLGSERGRLLRDSVSDLFERARLRKARVTKHRPGPDTLILTSAPSMSEDSSKTLHLNVWELVSVRITVGSKYRPASPENRPS